MKNDAKVTSITLNYNGQEFLSKCVESLKNSDYRLYEIIVVDNHSEDDSIDFMKKNFPDVVVLRNQGNFGVARGYNVGIRHALKKPIDYVFTIDNDLYVDSRCLSELVSQAEKNLDIGAIGTFVYDVSNPNHLLSAGGRVDFTQNVSRLLKAFPLDNELIDVDFCGTGHRLVRRKVFDEIGLLDEIFIGYGFEDTDFGFRVRKAGYRNCTCPAAKAWHKPFSGIGAYTFRKKYLESRNAVLFMKRYAGFKEWAKYLFFAVMGLPFAFLYYGLMKKRMGGVWGKTKGLIDGFRGREEMAHKMLGLSGDGE